MPAFSKLLILSFLLNSSVLLLSSSGWAAGDPGNREIMKEIAECNKKCRDKCEADLKCYDACNHPCVKQASGVGRDANTCKKALDACMDRWRHRCAPTPNERGEQICDDTATDPAGCQQEFETCSKD